MNRPININYDESNDMSYLENYIGKKFLIEEGYVTVKHIESLDNNQFIFHIILSDGSNATTDILSKESVDKLEWE